MPFSLQSHRKVRLETIGLRRRAPEAKQRVPYRFSLFTACLCALALASCSRENSDQDPTVAAPPAPTPAVSQGPTATPPSTPVAAQRSSDTPSLQASLLWEASDFIAPESVHYDTERRQIYVSNIGGDPLDASRSGFLSLLAEDGAVIALRWMSGLQAPKGLTLCNGYLYVADLNEIVQVDVEKAEIRGTWKVGKDDRDVGFLNDISCGPDGKIYISDMTRNRIYVLVGQMLSTWLDEPALQAPNGLLATEQGLLVASWGTLSGDGLRTSALGDLKQVDYQNQMIQPLGNGELPLGNLDGLEQDRRGDYLVSDWSTGRVFRVIPEGGHELLLSLTQGTADIGYIREYDILLIPLMKENTLQAYQLHEAELP